MPLGDVLRRPDEPERRSGRIDDDAAPSVDDALGTVVEHDAMLHLERLSRLERTRDLAARELAIGRVNPCEVLRVRELAGSWIEAEDPVLLARPRDAIGGDVPLPAAEMCECLRLGEALGRLLSLREHRAEHEQADRCEREQRLQGLHGAVSSDPSGLSPVTTPAIAIAATRRHPVAAPSCRKRKRRQYEQRKDRVRVAPPAAEEDGCARPRDQRGQRERLEDTVAARISAGASPRSGAPARRAGRPSRRRTTTESTRSRTGRRLESRRPPGPSRRSSRRSQC